jgi:hypothetical protein
MKTRSIFTTALMCMFLFFIGCEKPKQKLIYEYVDVTVKLHIVIFQEIESTHEYETYAGAPVCIIFNEITEGKDTLTPVNKTLASGGDGALDFEAHSSIYDNTRLQVIVCLENDSEAWSDKWLSYDLVFLNATKPADGKGPDTYTWKQDFTLYHIPY